MTATMLDCCAIAAALCATFMAGSRHLKRNILFYTLQTILLAFATAIRGSLQSEEQLYLIAIAIALLKAISIPLFLRWIVRKLCIYSDPGIMIAPPLVMHLSLILFACSYFEIASIGHSKGSSMAASASASLLLTGLLLMLTRRTALSQIIGFLVIENGIYLFAMTQTTGMPLIVEMGILLDVLAGVMIAGLVAFRIQKSFEHIDVTQLAELKDE